MYLADWGSSKGRFKIAGGLITSADWDFLARQVNLSKVLSGKKICVPFLSDKTEPDISEKLAEKSGKINLNSSAQSGRLELPL